MRRPRTRMLRRLRPKPNGPASSLDLPTLVGTGSAQQAASRKPDVDAADLVWHRSCRLARGRGTMAICEADPWRLQYFENIPCPDGVDVPTEDADGWTWYPRHRWVY